MTESKNMLNNVWVKSLIGTLILCVLGPISVNLVGYVPVTLQSLAVILVPMILGWRIGLVSISAYLLLGGFGLPVFANFNSGFDVFTGVTAGFLFGFLPAGAFSGWYAERVKVQYGRFFFIFFGAHLILLFCGALGLLFYGQALAEIWDIIVYLFPGLMVKSFLGAFVVLAVKMKKSAINLVLKG